MKIPFLLGRTSVELRLKSNISSNAIFCIMKFESMIELIEPTVDLISTPDCSESLKFTASYKQ